jgi:hypothetical protein
VANSRKSRCLRGENSQSRLPLPIKGIKNRSELVLRPRYWDNLSDIGIDGVLRSGRSFEVAVASGKLQCLTSPEPENWMVYIKREFNERSGIALLGEFLGNGRTNH